MKIQRDSFVKKGEPLAILRRMSSVSFPWVASTNLDAVAARSIQATLLSLSGPSAILKQIDGNLNGFTPAQASDYDEFENEVMRKASLFDE